MYRNSGTNGEHTAKTLSPNTIMLEQCPTLLHWYHKPSKYFSEGPPDISNTALAKHLQQHKRLRPPTPAAHIRSLFVGQ